MTTPDRLKRTVCLLSLFILPIIAHALTVIEIEQSQMEIWADTEVAVTVPTSTAYDLPLPGGDRIILNEDTVFKVKKKDGEIDRVIILNGELVLERRSDNEEPFTIEAGGSEITSNGGAGLAITVDDGTTSLTRIGDSGNVSIDGDPVAPGTGGTIGGDGAFTPSETVADDLGDSANRLLDLSSPGGGPPDGVPPGPPTDVPAGQPPYERIPELPEQIVRENLNDVTPS